MKNTFHLVSRFPWKNNHLPPTHSKHTDTHTHTHNFILLILLSSSSTILLLIQHPHHPLKSHQSHRIRRKRSHKTRHKPPPIPLPSTFPIHGPRSIPPREKFPLGIQSIRHDSLLHHIRGITTQPKNLRGQPACPEVDGGCAQFCSALELGCEDVVGGPPEEKGGAEDEGGGETVVDSSDAVLGVDFAETVNGSGVLSLGFGG